MSTELQTLRGRAFFWLGMMVFPLFWVWWLNARQFTTRQIRGARLWTVLYVLAAVVAWWVSPAFRTRLGTLQWTYSHVAFQVGIALWIWLAFRTLKLAETVAYLIVGVDIIATLVSLTIPFLHQLQPHPGSLLYILIPAAAHLSVAPIRRYREELHRLPWCSMSQSLVTEEHDPVNLQEALQIADRYWDRAVENSQTREQAISARTFGFGWKNHFMEICIKSPTEISCTLESLKTWPWKGTLEQEEQLHDRDTMRQRIQELYTCPPEELRRRFKHRL